MKAKRKPRRLDLSVPFGVLVGVGLVWLGLRLEGGSIQSVLQATAAVIVFGGTLGAVLVSFSFAQVRAAVAAVARSMFDTQESPQDLIATIMLYAVQARRRGILSLEDDLPEVVEPFLRRGLTLAVDGAKPQTIREVLDIEDAAREEEELVPARVFEAAGGYAPTLGILGAVLGLIQVMGNLTEPGKLGAGIAVAFVATVYGVGAANLLFLPLAAKLRLKATRALRHRQLIVEGVLAIQEGLNPWLIDQKLRGFLQERSEPRQRPDREHAA